MRDYGRLANRTVDEMLAGARVEVAPFKRDPMDFVLWKPSKPGEPAWPSPGGISAPGRPGWHIECSAMSWKHLGETFDIHGGGIDLVFPHHENEIAQSRCAFRTRLMAQVWMHNGFLQVEGEKMAKSLGNFVTIDDLLRTKKFGGHDWPGSALRFAMLQTLYRQPLDWTVRSLDSASHVLDDLVRASAATALTTPTPAVLEALCDDLNIPAVVAELHAIRRRVSVAGKGDAAIALRQNLNFLGIDRANFVAWLEREEARVLARVGDIEDQIAARNAARKAKNFKEADRIRDELAKMGVVLHDKKDGTTEWEVPR
jgi:cysteinyl-tRNA synthetase